MACASHVLLLEWLIADLLFDFQQLLGEHLSAWKGRYRT